MSQTIEMIWESSQLLDGQHQACSIPVRSARFILSHSKRLRRSSMSGIAVAAAARTRAEEPGCRLSCLLMGLGAGEDRRQC